MDEGGLRQDVDIHFTELPNLLGKRPQEFNFLLFHACGQWFDPGPNPEGAIGMEEGETIAVVTSNHGFPDGGG